MTRCKECGSIEKRRCPSCESVDADEMLREAREEGRREGVEEAIATIQRTPVYGLTNAQQLTRVLRELLEAK